MRYHNFQTEDRVENKGGAKLLVCLLTIISLTLLLAGCQGNNLQKDSLTEIKIAILQVYSTGLMVAADRSDTIDPGTNCFTKAGLKPILIKRSKGPEVVDALLGGSAEVGTLAVTPQALQAVQGNQLVAFSTIQTADKDIKVIGHRSSGINGGSSLKGKKVGYVGGTYGEIFLSRYLTKHGLNKSNVSLVSAPPAQLRDLFTSKNLDAIVLWEPFIQDILRDSKKMISSLMLIRQYIQVKSIYLPDLLFCRKIQKMLKNSLRL
jgi:sulfonate transport system substrate-binding protein